MGKVKNWTVEKKDEIESILIRMWASLAMDIPENFEDIVQDCYEDVCETADPVNWSDGDVTIAFRRWIEAQSNRNVRPEPMSDTKELHCPTGIKDSNNVPVRDGDVLIPVNAEDFVKIAEDDFICTDGLDGTYNVRLNTVGDLRSAMSELDDDDQITLVTIDLDSGDEIDHYPMHLDVIDGIELTNGKVVNEVQIVQEMNSKPDTRDKSELVDAVIQNLMQDYYHGDETVITELLTRLPWEILKGSLPEDRWEEFNK